MPDRPVPHPHPARRRWMAVLARADAPRIDALLSGCPTLPGHTRLRGPEAGLVMLRGRTGGGGGAFNLGEMTVTRCTIRTATGLVGHATIAGRNEDHAERAALIDALMQDPARTEQLDRHLITPLEIHQAAAKSHRADKAAATRVQFFAMQTTRA